MAALGMITVHGFHASSCTWRVRLALDYKGIPYKYKGVNLAAGEHLSEEYKKINPSQLVPSVEIDGAVLNDSIAILEYLEERFPEKPLLPKDLTQRAAVRSFVNIISSGIQPIQNLRVLNAIGAMGGDTVRDEWARNWISAGFGALEAIAKKTGGRFCCGEEFTMADAVLVPQLRNAHRWKVDLEKFPALYQLENNLYQLDVVKNSTPEHMPDFPKQPS